MKKIFFAAMLLAATFGFIACGDDEPDNGNDNNYSQLIIGTWHVSSLTFNGQDMTPHDMTIIFTDDGTGLLNDEGVIENNEFKWEIKGNTLTIKPREGSSDFTIESMDDEKATVSGNSIPGMDSMQGDVKMILEKRK